MIFGEHFRKHGTVHAIWAISILLLVILGLVFRSPDSDRLGTVIGFAASAVSVVLALLAIVYSAISNQSFSQTLGALKESSENIKNTARNIAETSSSLSQKAEMLSEHVEKVPSAVEALSSKIDQKLFELGGATSKKTRSRKKGDSAKEDLYDRSNFGTKLILYLLARSFLTKIKIDPVAMIHKEKHGLGWGGVILGSLSLARDTSPHGIKIDHEKVGGQHLFTVSSLGSLDAESIVERFTSYDDGQGNLQRIIIDRFFDRKKADGDTTPG